MQAGNVLFNNELNTFYLQLYNVWTYSKGPLRKKGNPLLPLHRILFQISSKGFLYAPPTDRIAHTTAFAGMRNSLVVHHEGLIRQPIDLIES